jgi:hypothetical protein
LKKKNILKTGKKIKISRSAVHREYKSRSKYFTDDMQIMLKEEIGPAEVRPKCGL